MATSLYNPANGHSVEINFSDSLGACILGIFYYVGVGLWAYVVTWCILLMLTIFGLGIGGLLIIFIFHFFSMFTVQDSLRRKYYERGYVSEQEYNRVRAEKEQQRRAAAQATQTPAPADDTRPCPYCAETIKKAAIRCKHCGADIAAAPTS